MTGAENKVKYNIKNVHVAKQTEKTTEGATTYTYEILRKVFLERSASAWTHRERFPSSTRTELRTM